MTAITKIIVAGIGGVGGYFGGLLARRFYDDKNVMICFLSRGPHLKEIKKNGLKVIKGEIEFIAKPNIATDNTTEIGIADLIIICTKSYDLEKIVEQLKPCINEKTMILPLLNGVNNKQRIKRLLPHNTILDGCVYLVSRLKEFGVIENNGNIETLYFGLDNASNEKLNVFRKLFEQAHIKVKLVKNISTTIWEKYIFLSPLATVTCYYNKCIGEILSDMDAIEITRFLILEVQNLAKAKGITFSGDIVETTIDKLRLLPYDATTSMHTDFKEKKIRNELETLTKYVIDEGKRYRVPTPIYVELYSVLENKNVY